MTFYRCLFSVSLLSLVSFFSFSSDKTFAQNSDSRQCVANLVRQGLKNPEASVWCNYQQECLVRSQKEGLPLATAEMVCECTIKEFRKQYDVNKFRELTQKSNTDRRVASQLQLVGEKCFEDILFQ